MDNEIIRFNKEISEGLSSDEIEIRKNQKMVNKTSIVVGKSYWQIIRDDVFSLFNITLFIIAIFIIIRNISYLNKMGPNGIVIRWYSDLFFLGILLLNIILSLYQDLKARALMTKLRVVTAPRATVVRDCKTFDIATDELVLDDIVLLKTDSQISADSIVVSGTFQVNESLLTGEPKSITKAVGDIVYSGSYVVSGSGYVRVEKVGKDSYIETVQNKANKFKRSPSQILLSLRRLFRVIGAVVFVVAVFTIITKAVQQQFTDFDSFMKSVSPISGSLVGMIPAGLYLLTSVALAAGVISLAKKRAQVQDFYSIEMLSRTEVLCVDKTGTITDGTMVVESIVPLNGFGQARLEQIISNIIHSTKDNNATAKALLSYFSLPTTATPTNILPFNSENKYSAVSFKGEGTYVLGAGEFINLKNKEMVLNLSKEYTSKGYRVLVVAEGSAPLLDKIYTSVTTAIGIIVLKDHIRDTAVETFKWFNDNGVEIRVISGDNVSTVAEIARQAGILNADKCISLENMTPEEVYEIANDYIVFGRVTPEQKEAIIKSLKDKKKIVAMTGDGVNDILALKRADCSIAMASGAEAARNVSHIVLLDSNFDTLPDVVGEGRRVVNNLQRTCSLFLVKTLFVAILSIIFVFAGFAKSNLFYPFSPSNMYLWEIITIGLAAFFLALQPNREKVKKGFIRHILKKAIPGGALMLVSILSIFVLYLLNKNQIIYTGIGNFQVASTMAVITFSFLSLVVLFGVCKPFDKYRACVFGVSAIVVIGLLLGIGLNCGLNNIKENVFSIRFDLLSPLNVLTIAIVVVLTTTLYLAVLYIIETITGGIKND